MVTCTEGVGRSDVTGLLCEDRSENRRSTAVKVSDHLVEGHDQLQTRTRQQIPDQPCREAKTIHSVASLIRGKSKLLVLENPDTVKIYKSFLRGQREARKSNVAVTMTYLGQGRRGSGLGPTQDELKILQQVNGGENICVFKGLVSPGDSKKDEEAFAQMDGKEKGHLQSRLRDFYEECVERSIALEQSLSKHSWFQANSEALESDVERSAESDTVPQCDEEPKADKDTRPSAGKEEPVQEQDLEAQLDAMMQVLRTSAEVEQLVLRNTDLTDDLLLSLAGALKSSPSELPARWGSFEAFALLELDIGGNGLSSNGVKLLASYIRHHSHLQYLGLAQTSSADLAAWKELFDSLKGNKALIHIILDENNLGDPGVRLLAEVLKENRSLRQVDLDRNGISDLGGNDIMGALLCRLEFPLRHLGLEGNNISAGLMSRIQEEIK
ncbi:unnamed protein product [Tetraodon nigroviridis]|uniref:(spotted green pufferfish) hypothetical protein n=1 Tax=Tetraodon nigroviridis TaxID=99883 RepID=Q4RTZ7_TETNG|nr:unnamed protein product [Tetraodon nigroviridis]